MLSILLETPMLSSHAEFNPSPCVLIWSKSISLEDKLALQITTMHWTELITRFLSVHVKCTSHNYFKQGSGWYCNEAEHENI